MSNETRERYLKLALVVFGVVFWLIYPLGLVWPSGERTVMSANDPKRTC